jgi:glycerol-3-phosphate dehydrogenase
VVINYVKVVSLLKQNDRIIGARVRDLESGNDFEVRARVVINATGVFADEVRQLDNAAKPALLTTSQGAHLVLDKSFLPGHCALMAPRTADGRIFFAIPWHGRVLIGTTETAVPSVETEPRPLPGEVEFLLNHAAQHLIRAPVTSDILGAFAGLRPLLKGADGKLTSALSRSHLVEVAPSGLVTITGGKWTTYRQMAEDAVNRATAVGGLPRRESRTRDLRLHDASDQVTQDRPDDRPLHPRLPYRTGEVRWAVRQAMARSIADVLARRTRALLLDARASMEIAPDVARIMAAELGRDDAWAAQQVKSFCELAHGSLFP